MTEDEELAAQEKAETEKKLPPLRPLTEEEVKAEAALAKVKGKPGPKPKVKEDPAVESATEEPAEKPPGELVMYTPGDHGPAKTTWRGVEFKANVPVMIYDEDHILAARGNRSFSVGNSASADDENQPPQDAMEYRGHVVSWLKDVETIDQFVAKWAGDRELRAKCEVARDDLNYLGTLIEPKLTAMRKAEGKSPNDVAGAFVSRGILEIPWRS